MPVRSANSEPGCRMAGVVGWPVEHSRSPEIFQHWFRRYGIAGAYERYPARPGEFKLCIERLRTAGFQGCNVTIPHKESAFALTGKQSATARRTGSVNTLVFRSDGGIEGDSTDGFGFLEALYVGLCSRSLPAGPAVVLGAGGAARAVVDALANAGVPQVRIVNRTLERAERLAQEIPGPLVAVALRDAGDALRDAVLVVNATSLGMTGAAPLFLDSSAAPREAVVMDLVYAPLKTPLLARAEELGQRTVGGLGMLLHQARPGFRRWFGVDPVVDAELRQAVLEKAVS